MTILHSKSLIRAHLLVVAAFFSASTFAQLAIGTAYDFDVTYDGAVLSWDGGGDNPIGASLVDGDSFNYNLHAAGDDYWQVDLDLDYFPFLAFTIDEPGDRIGDMTLSFYLDGVQQGASMVENGIINSEVHLGTNGIVLSSGLSFDEIILEYILTSSTELEDPFNPIAATINSFTIGPNVPGGFGEGISYVAAVPIPAAAWLFGSALLGLGVIKRRTTV